MGTNSEILLTAEPLGLGETVRIQCPSCMGDRPTLTVTKRDDGAILWNCYRASCDERGARGSGGYVAAPRDQRPKPRTNPYEGTLTMLDDDHRNFLEYKIGWNVEHIALARARWAEDLSRYAFPIYGPDWHRRGWVMRSWSAPTKAYTMMDVDEPHLAWYRRDAGPIIVVEDIPSAVRAAQAGFANAVALCGTSCGHEYALEIAQNNSRVVWALDADATTTAMRMHQQWQPLFDESRVLVLPCDIKDMREPTLVEFLKEVL